MDDLGWADLSSYGSTFYETPHLDKLASEGLRFTNAYAACPVCSPTRASIMTGKYPARLGITNYLPGKHPLAYSKLIGTEPVQNLPLEEVTIPEALAPLGYISGHIGKWHLGSEPFFPEKQGFATNVGGTNSGMPASFFYPQWGKNPPVEAAPGEYLTDRLTDEAIRFLDANKSRPFFLYLAHYAVHVPIEAKQELVAKYRKKLRPGQRQNDPVYAAMIQSMDESVGRIMKTIDDLGLRRNTVILFTSDNGGLSAPEWKLKPVTSNFPLREGKGHVYEGGIRVPLIVRGPAFRKGAVVDQPVCSVDYFSTLLDLAGSSSLPKTDGVSLAGLLQSDTELERRDLFWHYPHYSNQLGRPASAIRRGTLKLIQFHEDNHVELYDISEDVGEAKDLSGALPEKTRELKDALAKWLASVNARMPTANPKYDPAREGEGYWWKTGTSPK